ncbi:MAG TPA: hypothetical protein VME69_04770 [Methylocella sp.]|nr:hypothetical protein [Methylocella sp.]
MNTKKWLSCLMVATSSFYLVALHEAAALHLTGPQFNSGGHSYNTYQIVAPQPIDSAEDNTLEQSATVSNQQIQLSLAIPLDLNSAQSAYHYQVTVEGSPVSGFFVSASPGTDGTTLVLTLPEGSFAAGDAIGVSWNGLKNVAGQSVSGSVDLIAQ